MKNFKRILATVLAVLFVASMMVVGVSAASSDSAWYKKAVDYLDGLTISNIGSTGGELVSRDEFVTWVAKIESHQLIESAWKKQEWVALSTFSDVGDSEHQGAIGYAIGRNFIKGNGDGTFSPHEAVKFGEAAAIVVRLMAYENKVTGETWDEQVANYEFVANTFCGAFDATFLAKTAQYDADHKLTKGEAAYILYTIMNGAAWADDEISEGEYYSLRRTSYGVDLGEFFATNGGATVKAQYVVANIPLVKTNTAQQSFKRYDAYVTGATYASLFSDYLDNTNGLIDKTSGKVVTLQNLATGNYLTIPTSTFASLVKTAAGHKDDDTDAMNYIEKGNVITISAKRDNKDALAGSATATSALSTSVITNFVINDFTAADGYIGYAATTLANINTGKQVTGWKYLGAKAAAVSTYARLTSTPVTWTNVKYNSKGVPTSGNLVLGEETYTVVTSYTGKANEIKVYAPADILSGGTTKTIVSVVGRVGDVVYAGGVFSADQKAILNLHRSGMQALAVTGLEQFAAGVVYYELDGEEYVVTADQEANTAKTYYIDDGYGEFFDGNTVTETFEIEEEIPSWIAYELDVTGGKFVTSIPNNIISEFVVDGRLDANTINTAKALKVEEALQLILGPAQGECEVIFSDTDGDGAYDIAVVTESTRALYYGEVNSSTDPGNEGYLGGNASWTREVYDSFGNYITSMQGLKGHNIGGLVVDKTVAFGKTNGTGTDGWNITSTTPSNKVQVVVCFSNERQLFGGNGEKGVYGIEGSPFPYKTVDIAALTTGYIEWVASGTSKVGGVEVYTASVIKADGERTTVYIPVNPADKITLSVTLDGVASDVTFSAGRSLLSFVTDYNAANQIGEYAKQNGSWMAGHTVKYVAYENGVAWCMIDTAEKSAVTGYVTGVTKTDSGDNTYKVTVVASASEGSYSSKFASTAESIANVITYGYSTAMAPNAFGIDALFAAEGEMTVTAYVVTQAAIDEFTKLTNSNVFHGIPGDAPLTALYYDGEPDGTKVPGLVGTGYTTKGIVNAGTILSAYDYFAFVRPEYQNDTYFTETEFDAYDLFGYIDWTVLGELTASSTTKYIGASVKTLEVKGSATAVWTYDPSTYALVNAVLVKGTLYNTNNVYNGQVISQDDLVYLSFTKDAGSYYTIDGLDYASYEVDAETGKTDWGTLLRADNQDFFMNSAISKSTGYRTRSMFAYRYPLLTTGAGTDMMWTNGSDDDFVNAYILGYKKTDADRVTLTDGNGYYDMYDMIVGYNPYYVRNVSNEGKITYTLMFSVVKKLTGVKGTFYHPVDASSTLLIALINQSTMKQEVDDGVSYTDTATYYVDPTTSLVYLIHGEPVYDTTKTTKDTPEYDTTGADEAGQVEDIAASAIKEEYGLDKDVKEESLVSLSFAPFTEDEAGYVPGLYHAYLTNGLGTTRRFQINQNVKIVVIYPDSETGNFKITVTTAKDIYANKATVFVTDYQYKGAEACTMLSVIGKINKPVAAVVDDNENTVTAGSRLVYLNGDATVIAEAIQLSNYWVIRSTDSAIDVTTGEEVGSIQFVFTTYKEDNITKVQKALEAGGYFLINKDNEVISAVSEAAGEYGTATEFAQVLTGVITGVTADGKTTATIKGVENTDISKKTFKFIYHDMDGANFGIGGTSTNVAVSTTTEIKATYSADEAIVAEGVNKSPNYYTKDDVAKAAENVAAAKVAAIDAYLNGTFWNVEFSPLYNYFVSQRVSYQNRGDVTLTFNYVVINDVYYVFVNSFTK